VDLVVEIGGAETFQQSIRATRMNAMIAAIGNVTGSVGEINWPLLFMFKKNVAGISSGCTREYEDMCRAIGANGMKPVVDERIYDFDGLKSAIMSIKEGKHFGNIAVKF
jgi:NADPH:quinone reductase-like Zn-dependent oxidoreductase